MCTPFRLLTAPRPPLPPVLRYQEEVQLGSASWLGEEMMSALSSEDMQGLTGRTASAPHPPVPFFTLRGRGCAATRCVSRWPRGWLGRCADLEDDDDSDLDDVSSLSFSDVSVLRVSASKRAAAVAERARETMIAQKRSTNEEFDEYKRERKREEAGLRNQLQQLQHDKEMLQLKLDHLQRRYETERRDVEERHLGPARARLAALEAENARAREGLQASKEQMLSAVRISRMEYEQLSAMPDAERGVAQHIGVMVWNMLEEVRKSRDAALREAEELRHRLSATTDAMANLQHTWDDQHKAAAERQVEQGKALADASGRCSALQQEVDKLRAELTLHESRSRRCEGAEEQCNVARTERLAALAQRDEARLELERTRTEKDHALQRAEEREREAEMMRLDKEFLARQHADLTAKCQRAEDKLEKKALKLNDAQRVKEQLEAQIIQIQALSAASHEDRVQAELSALRQRADQEMADIRRSTAELYQRQNQMLSDAKEEAQAEVDRLRNRLSEVEKARDIAVREHMELATSMEAQIGEARSVAKIKTMELDRLHVAYEDAQTLNRQLRLETDMYRDKVDVVRTELCSLQSSSDKRIAELEAQVHHSGHRLQTFESIESNLSLAIADVGDFGPAGNLEIENHIMALGTGAPTDPTRRMAQTMALARKVIAQQKELESLKRSLEEHQAEVLRLQRALADANKLLDNTAQPHELLVSAVRSRDEDLRSNRAEIERLKTVLAAVQGERNKLRDQCAELKKNIEQVVEKRNTTETLQTAVAHLQAQEQINLMKLNQARLRRGATSAASATDYWNLTALAGAEGAGTLSLGSQLVPPGTGWLGLSGGGLAGSGSQQIAQQIAQQPQPQALWFQKLKAKAS